MNKSDVIEVIQTIETLYNNPFTKNIIPSEQKQKIMSVVEAWYSILKDYEFNQVMKNLREHVKRSRFAPTVSDLVQEKHLIVDRMNAIPNAEETQAYLESLTGDREKNKNLSEEDLKEIEKAKAEARRILGIG